MTPLGRLISWPFLAIASIPGDKLGHLWIGTVLGLSSLWLGWLLAALPIIIIAALKEAWDHAHPPHKAELWDFLATCIGGALSIGAVHLHRLWP